MRWIFEIALQCLAVPDATLQNFLFITEDASHVQACRGYGMKALQFGSDFQHWAAAARIAAQ